MDIEAPIEASGQVLVEPFVASLNESLTEPKKKGSKKSEGSGNGSEDRLSTEPVTVAMPAPSMPKKNVAAYMAGHLIKNIH